MINLTLPGEEGLRGTIARRQDQGHRWTDTFDELSSEKRRFKRFMRRPSPVRNFASHLVETLHELRIPTIYLGHP